jgi:anaerobic magnesium-protoporphyrin IX monomethyl ester cyclase
MPAATRIHEMTRRLRPSARIILGGPHVSLVHAAAKYERKRSVLGRASRSIKQLNGVFVTSSIASVSLTGKLTP